MAEKKYILYTIDLGGTSLDEFLVSIIEVSHEGMEEQDDKVLLYIDANELQQQSSLTEILDRLSLQYSKEPIENQNWNEVWESNFEPVIIDGYCYIRAAHHPTIDNIPYTIHITPKMSFGTGHHATTYQVLQMMRSIFWSDKKVLDFGTGTGILAIHAHQLGAVEILAIDNDEWAYDNTIENISLNDANNIIAGHGSLEMVEDKDYDIILANINRHILLQYMPDMCAKLNQGGSLIISGILIEDKDIMTESLKTNGFHIQNITDRNNWLCILAIKK